MKLFILNMGIKIHFLHSMGFMKIKIFIFNMNHQKLLLFENN